MTPNITTSPMRDPASVRYSGRLLSRVALVSVLVAAFAVIGCQQVNYSGGGQATGGASASPSVSPI